MIGWAALEAIVKYSINTHLWPHYNSTTAPNKLFQNVRFWIYWTWMSSGKMDRMKEEDMLILMRAEKVKEQVKLRPLKRWSDLIWSVRCFQTWLLIVNQRWKVNLMASAVMLAYVWGLTSTSVIHQSADLGVCSQILSLSLPTFSLE